MNWKFWKKQNVESIPVKQEELALHFYIEDDMVFADCDWPDCSKMDDKQIADFIQKYSMMIWFLCQGELLDTIQQAVVQCGVMTNSTKISGGILSNINSLLRAKNGNLSEVCVPPTSAFNVRNNDKS